MTFLSGIKAFFTRELDIRDARGVPDVGGRGDAGEIVTESSVLALSSVWACVNLVAGTISSLPPTVYKDVDGVRVAAKDHPLYRILHDSPNFDQTALDFWEYMASSLELWGNAYARKIFSGGVLSGLMPINPSTVVVKRLKGGDIEYAWSEDGKQHRLTDRDVFHVRGFGGNPLGGMSTLQFGRNTFSLARAVDKSAGQTFQNGLRPSGTLTFENFLSPENREIAENELVEKFAGAVNVGRPMVLEGGAKWSSISINPEDAQMLESRGFSVEEVCRFFGVPPFMIGHTEKTTSWGTGLEQQTLAFQKFTLRRRLKRIEQAVSKQLLTASDRAQGVVFEFNLEGLLRGDSAARAAFYKAGLNDGWLNINQVCAFENLPPVEGGDVNRVQMQNVPISEAGNDDAV